MLRYSRSDVCRNNNVLKTIHTKFYFLNVIYTGGYHHRSTQTTGVETCDKCQNTVKGCSPLALRVRRAPPSVREGVLVNLDASDEEGERPRGPRHCAVRVQAGSSNILLDNVVDNYAPVLYKSRPDALVHSPRSRSGSSSNDDKPLRTETQI